MKCPKCQHENATGSAFCDECAAVPIPDPVLEAERPQQIVTGEVPSVLNPPRGCRFHPRCPKAMARCAEEEPLLREAGSGRVVACHLVH